ncbi:cation:proton antiporter subunit C [Modestobacter marinus]|uniref:Cation:proton antiporter n=1 Tax=Modestobacter marinus TaxID=477641 RepID=A0A846LBV2_9ACTN|nr:cation:proton antiporter subunit C [Modestobacter marinus]NIH65583.1 multicomponent Na+:H+ antiporter subunit C [Modestobacter marinus]GGL65570.1 cation:proton antiporter [Modestobacter marinus]
MSAAVLIGVLVAGGVWLVLQRGPLPVVFGFVLLGHAVNVLLLAAGGTDRRGAPFAGRGAPATTADPLPQAFVLTAIVIAFGITVYLLGLVRAERPDEAAPDPGDPDPVDARDGERDDAHRIGGAP